MKTKYLISELANIFNISRQTLIFYHKKSILVPNIIDEETGYRYYSTDQIWDLFFIITLKKAGLSLDEIKTYVEIKPTQEGINFLENKVNEIDKKIRELESSKLEIIKKINSAKYSLEENEEEIKIIEKVSFKYLKIDLKNKDDEAEMASIYNKLHLMANKYKIKDLTYIAKIDLANVLSFKTTPPIFSIGIIIPDNIDIPKSEILSLSKSVSLKSSSPYENQDRVYKRLFNYLEKSSYNHLNYSYEIATDFMFNTENGLSGIFEILIPLKD